jgi:uncharacterized surface protein with fasciclin (FAS1) repeats
MRREFLKTVLAFGVSGTLSGCFGGGGSDDPPTIATVVADTPDLQTFEEALAAASLTALLDDRAAAYTVFAPNNAAFEALFVHLGLTKDELFADVSRLTDVLNCHVIAAEVLAASLPRNQPIASIGGESLSVYEMTSGALIVVDGGGLNGGQITQADVQAANGVIHVIDGVLLPVVNKNIVQTLIATPRFSTLVEALAAADVMGTLEGTGPFNLFAPTNAAFDALFVELGITKDELFSDLPLLTAVVTGHILNNGRTLGEWYDQEFTGAALFESLSGAFLLLSLPDGSRALEIEDGRARHSASTSPVELVATNGVVQGIDRVLLPADKNIVQTTVAIPELSTLAEGLVIADLVTTLEGAGPFTLFAPTNDAFDALFVELGTTKDLFFADVPLLTSVLKYHVAASAIGGAFDFDFLIIKGAFPTLEGGYLDLRSTLLYDDIGRSSTFNRWDILNSNGMLHTLDRVMLPFAI